MLVSVHLLDSEANDLQRSYGERVAQFHLGRFGREVSSVTLWIETVAYAGAPLGARCRITVRGPNVHATRLDVLSTDALLAMDAATEWAARTVGKLLHRNRLLEEEALPEAS